MTSKCVITVRLDRDLRKFVSSNAGHDGPYESVSEYIRDLIRRDMTRAGVQVSSQPGPKTRDLSSDV